MQHHKSQRHVNAAKARWRAAEARAQAERDAGIPDEPAIEDCREAFPLPLKCAGYRDLRIEPRRGYVAWRAIDAATGEVLHCAALKTTTPDAPAMARRAACVAVASMWTPAIGKAARAASA